MFSISAYETEACNSNTKTLTATTEKQVLTSPRFPGEYPRFLVCILDDMFIFGLSELKFQVSFYDHSLFICRSVRL